MLPSLIDYLLDPAQAPATTQTEVVLFLLRVVLAVVVFLLALRLARLARRAAGRFLSRVELPAAARSAVEGLAYYGVLALGVGIALVVAGVSWGAIFTSLGLLILILAIALRESLSNIAATTIFLVFQPFRPGEMVEFEGTVGHVKEIQVFYTVLKTLDNKLMVFPNGRLYNEAVTNYSRLGAIRADMFFALSYRADVARARAILEDEVRADPRVLAEPAALFNVDTLNNGTINLAARPYCKPEDLYAFRWDIYERVKRRFDREGIALAPLQTELYLRDGGAPVLPDGQAAEDGRAVERG